jgi:hydroxyethylthiazole kinase-like uncharacterized protein yjeF
VIEAYTVAEVQAAERALMATLPEGALMQRAATGLAHACARELGKAYGSRVLLLVGKGNNGADALWAGSFLARRGAQVTAVCVGEPVTDAAAALRKAGGRFAGRVGRGLASSHRGLGSHGCDDVPYDLVVDGLLGIGATGGLRQEVAQAISDTRRLGCRTLAVDLPTGVDADTGRVDPMALEADVTVTFGCWKPGLLVGLGRQRAGRVELVDIGLRPYLPTPTVTALEPGDEPWFVTGVPQPHEGQDKYTRGVVGIAAGSQTYTGAAVLAVGAALAAGAGMVRFAGAPHAAEQVRARWPEAVVTEATGAAVVDAGRVQAWVVGPGLGTDNVAAETVRAVLEQDVPVLVDADALTVCADHQEWLRARTAPTVLTPHDREFARFGREVGDDRIGAARALAADLGVVVLLKGSATVVALPDGTVAVNRTGSPVLATAGSGDVLSGATGALLAVHDTWEDGDQNAFDAAASAAHLHGLAGAISAGGASTTAERVLAAWPAAVRQVVAATMDA